jgi:hypothetical protein
VQRRSRDRFKMNTAGGLSFRALVTRAEGCPLVFTPRRHRTYDMKRLCIALLSHRVYSCFASRFSLEPRATPLRLFDAGARGASVKSASRSAKILNLIFL